MRDVRAGRRVRHPRRGSPRPPGGTLPVRRRRPHQGAHPAAPGPDRLLFTLAQSDAAEKAIRANGAPVDVDWIAGGHDGGDLEASRVQARVTSWFDRYLKNDKGADTGPAFRITRTGGVDSTDGAALLRGASDDTYPGLTAA